MHAPHYFDSIQDAVALHERLSRAGLACGHVLLTRLPGAAAPAGSVKGGPRRSMPLYMAVDSQLVLALADTSGDEARVMQAVHRTSLAYMPQACVSASRYRTTPV
jgi:hypothetical protein